MSCEICADPTVSHRLDQLGIDVERHAFLRRCPPCGTRYEVFPEEKIPARELTVDEARSLFPGSAVIVAATSDRGSRRPVAG